MFENRNIHMFLTIQRTDGIQYLSFELPMLGCSLKERTYVYYSAARGSNIQHDKY